MKKKLFYAEKSFYYSALLSFLMKNSNFRQKEWNSSKRKSHSWLSFLRHWLSLPNNGMRLSPSQALNPFQSSNSISLQNTERWRFFHHLHSHHQNLHEKNYEKKIHHLHRNLLHENSKTKKTNVKKRTMTKTETATRTTTPIAEAASPRRRSLDPSTWMNL